MKSFLSILSISALLLMAACTQNASKEKETADSLTQVKPKPSGPTMNQIPAAEVLGSKVMRHLRFQPEEEMATILSQDSMLAYISKVSLSFRHEVGKLAPERPVEGTVIVGVNAKHESKLWFSFPDSLPPSPEFKAAMRKGLDVIRKPAIQKDLIVFGVVMALWGHKETDEEMRKVNLPKEWTEVGKKFKGPQAASKLAAEAWNKGE